MIGKYEIRKPLKTTTCVLCDERGVISLIIETKHRGWIQGTFCEKHGAEIGKKLVDLAPEYEKETKERDVNKYGYDDSNTEAKRVGRGKVLPTNKATV